MRSLLIQKLLFYSHANKTHFHKKAFAHGLVLKTHLVQQILSLPCHGHSVTFGFLLVSKQTFQLCTGIFVFNITHILNVIFTGLRNLTPEARWFSGLGKLPKSFFII